DVYAIHDALNRIVSAFTAPHRIRLLVARDGSFELQHFPMKSAGGDPLRIRMAKEPVDSQDPFLFHKTTHRTAYESAFAKAAAGKTADEVILWNERGEVTEGCIANVVIRKEGKLITPPVQCGLLAGTFREHLLKYGEIEEGIVTLDDIRSAEEVFLVNSVRKWHKAEWAEEEEHT
ncbi:MAG TPA: aminotransferase class IV, partial [Pontiella sp.]|nr:aminotransferase class IV [Pontiella sp.]